MTRRKICVFTGTRAEYGLLYWLIKGINDDPDLALELIVAGMHMSPEFGLTYKSIEEDGFRISKKIESLMSSDTSVGISKSIALGVMSMAEALDELKPDMLVLLGDRYEVFAAATAAMVARIPIAHMHGGESTEGVIDESIRHSVTKMSHLHFTSTETYRNRVIQLGEGADKVYNVGALGIENINCLKLLSKEDFERSIEFRLGKKNLLITFHPVTLENSSSKSQFSALLEAVDEMADTNLIFTKANADTDGRIINELIDEYVSRNPERSKAFHSLGQLRYLSCLQYIDAVVGNSSSGLIEVPSFGKPTVNIGDRQKGRVRGGTVIDCLPHFSAIKDALNRALDQKFAESIKGIINPYGQQNASEKILTVLKEIDLTHLIKKEFNDLPPRSS